MISAARSLMVGLALLALAGRASALPAAFRDQGVQPSGSSGEQEPPKLPWHDTFFTWDNSVTTQTLGFGADYQSRNPTYEMMFRLAPRYYLLDRRERSLSLRADVRLLREFTDSDSTTERGEWTFADSELSLTGVQTVRDTPGSHSQLVLRLPTLTFPTSKTSALGGRILGLGLGIGLDQELTLLGKNAPALLSASLRPRFNYSYQLAEAVVATNDRIDRVRLDADGRSLPSDQLTGSTLPQHQVTASLRGELLVTSRLVLEAEFGMRYARRYALPSATLCVSTGCAEVPARSDATRWGVITLFSTSLSYEIGEMLEVSAGYANLSPELGADGRRRNVLYSPEARTFIALSVALDSLYLTARGPTSARAARRQRAGAEPRF
jgi:hypothetical protein